MASTSIISSSASKVSLINAESWLKKQLGSCASIKARIGWQGLTTKEYLNSGDYYLITGTDFLDGRIDWKNCHYVTKDRFDQDPHIKIQKGDVLVSKDGTIGKVAYLDELPGPGTLNSGVFVIRSKDKQVSQRYLAKVFVSKYFDDFIDSIVAGSTIVHLYQKDIVNFSFWVPPTIEEQDRIADVLEFIDNLVVRLDEAIAKKRQIKDGLMQQLLTGKTRLPGFKADWIELRFDDFISRFATGLNPRNNFRLNVDASNYYITIKDFADGVLYFDQCDKVSDEAIKRINERSDLRAGDVLFSSIGRVGDAYVIEETPTNWNINESVFSLRPNYSIIDSHFLYYLIKSKDAQAKFQESITGTTLRSIKMGHLKEIICAFPSDIDEQKAIANTLKSIDSDIISSETLRGKYCLIKQGMMQELLTGKTRL